MGDIWGLYTGYIGFRVSRFPTYAVLPCGLCGSRGPVPVVVVLVCTRTLSIGHHALMVGHVTALAGKSKLHPVVPMLCW